MMSAKCPACKSDDHQEFLALPAMPVSIGVQWPTKEEAVNCGRGNLQLSFCNSCGFIWNNQFDEELLEYSQKYDNSLDFSPVFQKFAENLARSLIETYNIRDKQIVELGCGKGHFLSLVCEIGNNSGVGFDPSYEGERIASSAADRINYIQDFYGEKYTNYPGDLICCRHVLEHITDPSAFLASTSQTVAGQKQSIVYFEVPNVRLILERLSVWDIIYEHCNYFSLESLKSLFERSGFEVLKIEETYQKQFIGLECRLADKTEPSVLPEVDLSNLSRLVNDFSESLRERIDSWQTRIEAYLADGKRLVVWGAGAKTVGFLNMLPSGDQVSQVVDINPHKQGLFLPGTGQEIVSPAALANHQPDVIILMNPIYKNEVSQQLSELGINSELIEA